MTRSTLLKQFVDVTSVSENVASAALEQHRWNLEAALDAFYSSDAAFVPSRTNPDKIRQFFASYAEGDTIEEQGMLALCKDLQIAPDDVAVLALMFHCGATAVGQLSRSGFIAGMSFLSVEALSDLRGLVPRLRKDTVNSELRKPIYQFTFTVNLDQGRTLPLQLCEEYWKILLRGWAPLEAWLSFVAAEGRKAISKDLWMMVFDLATTVKPDFSDYDTDGAWPVIIDDFVEHMKESKDTSGAQR